MKTTIDQAAVAAIATAALYPHRDPRFSEEPNCAQPENIAESILGMNDFPEFENSDKAFSCALKAFDCAFAFGLQLGARIGSDPLHQPDVEDLIRHYQFSLSQEVAA